MKQAKGFTLIELLIAIAIVGIIAAIALPSYNESIKKTRRSDAFSALAKGAAMQERLYTSNNHYSSAMANLGGAVSEDGFYTISVSIAACTNSCFVLSATPVAGKAQASDETCWTMTLDHTGRKASANKLGVANASKTCW